MSTLPGRRHHHGNTSSHIYFTISSFNDFAMPGDPTALGLTGLASCAGSRGGRYPASLYRLLVSSLNPEP